jgi:hypothetical protein
MTTQKLWHAKETAVAMGPAVTSPAATSSMYAQILAVGSTEVQLESVMKNVTVTPPDGAIDIENFLGIDTNYFQNAEVSFKPFTMGSITGTLVVTDVVKVEPWFMGQTGLAITNGTRYQPGCCATGKERQSLGIGIKLVQVGALNTAGTKNISIALNNAVITKVGDYKLSGADGTWEVDFEAKCLPRDFYVEYLTA